MTVDVALRQAQALLLEGGIAVPRLTSEVLLCHTLGCERSHLYGHPAQELSESEQLHFGRYLYERLNGKPTQYITGQQEFYGRPFRVTPAVMIPRPETEHVVEASLQMVPQALRVVDVGCGSGAIAITLQLEMQAEVWGTDVSAAALEVAADNARRLGASVGFVQCDLASCFDGNCADLLVSNPPYVPQSEESSIQREVREYEPHIALFGGESGLDFYKRLINEGARLLRPQGWLIMELGIRQLDPVRQMLDSAWRQVCVIDDLAGLPRVLASQYEP